MAVNLAGWDTMVASCGRAAQKLAMFDSTGLNTNAGIKVM